MDIFTHGKHIKFKLKMNLNIFSYNFAKKKNVFPFIQYQILFLVDIEPIN